MNGWAHAALSGAVLVAVTAVAGPSGAASPAVVPHPLVVVGGSDEDAVRLGPQLDAALARSDVRAVGEQCARKFVAARPGGSCAGDDRCLAELASACGGQRALYVSVYPYRPQMVFVGKLVRSDGLLERSVSNLEVTRPKGRLRPEMIRPGIEKVLREGLHLETLDLEPLVTTVPVDAVEAPPVTSHPEERQEVPAAALTVAPAQGASGQRIAAYACLGAGAVTLAVGAALFFGANSDESTYRATLDAAGQRPPTAEAEAQQQSLRHQSTTVTAVLVTGAVLVGAGVTLWVLDPGKSGSAHVELRPGAGGGSVVMAGRF
ncbi:MAG TPA: hypothetical protein VLQ79_11985 [Myxococcaceae bacterium]|nr:hypothetical protein [Myxococcaceae bacterium]